MAASSSSDVRASLSAKVDSYLPYAIETLSKWIQCDSLAGNEEPQQKLIASELSSLGLDVDVWTMEQEAITKHPYFVSPRSNFDASPLVVGTLKGAGGGRSIILNGHIDVVPVGDLSQWKQPPFSGNYDPATGALHGRGTSDMKGGVLSSLLAIKAVRELGLSLKGDVIFESVVEEESGGAGTLGTILRGYKADAALIPEPTNLKIFPKQQGSMWFRLKVKGLAAHGGTRYEGVSAIEKAMVVIAAIQKLESERNIPLKLDPLYSTIPIPIPINVGTISGGKWPSSVPDLVEITGRMGVAPRESIYDAQAIMRQALDALAEQDGWFSKNPVDLEWYGARWLPGDVDVDHELVKAVSGCFKEALGQDARIEASPWGTDGGLLTNLADTPSIVFGPGETSMAHQTDEIIYMQKVMQCAQVIALSLIDWCGVSQ